MLHKLIVQMYSNVFVKYKCSYSGVLDLNGTSAVIVFIIPLLQQTNIYVKIDITLAQHLKSLSSFFLCDKLAQSFAVVLIFQPLDLALLV